MRLLRLFVPIFVLVMSTDVWAQEYVPGELIVKMKDARTSSTSRFLGKASTRQKMSLKKSWNRFNIHQFQLKPGVSVEEAINDLHFDDDVEYAEPNYILRKQSSGIEGRPMSLSEIKALTAEAFGQEQAQGAEQFTQTSAKIRVEEAWSILSPATERPIVAVIDSGVDYEHYVFEESGAIWVNPGEIPDNEVDDDGNGYVDDVIGWNFVGSNNDPMDDDNHGTHVAGIVLGITQDILRHQGEISPAKIQIMPIKFLDKNGSGTTSNAIQAIYYAINNGAHVLNNSWGGGHFSQALHDAIVQTQNHNLAFVAAAGNAGNDNDASPTYPASYKIPNVVSLAASSSQDNLASFSNFGEQSVHLASPGISIHSTLPNGTFGSSSGTSMATPFAAGLAALMLREKSHITGHQVKGVLFDQSLGVESLLGKVASHSRMDAFEAIHFVQNTDLSTYKPSMEADRWLSSVGTGSASASGGCGLVKSALKNHHSGGSEPPVGGLQSGILLTLLFAPLLLALAMKLRHQDPLSRRAHPRFQVNSAVSIKVGDRELVGEMSSVSLGGACVNTEALLDQGGLVTLTVATPDGTSQFEVQGQVVWSEEKKAYGIKFLSGQSESLAQVGSWAQTLKKTS